MDFNTEEMTVFAWERFWRYERFPKEMKNIPTEVRLLVLRGFINEIKNSTLNLSRRGFFTEEEYEAACLDRRRGYEAFLNGGENPMPQRNKRQSK